MPSFDFMCPDCKSILRSFYLMPQEENPDCEKCKTRMEKYYGWGEGGADFLKTIGPTSESISFGNVKKPVLRPFDGGKRKDD